MAEMAEAMCASWLRNVKRCSLVQMNWKPSFQWATYDEDFVSEALTEACAFFHEHDLTIAQIEDDGTIDFYKAMMQTECDVLGMTTENEHHIPEYFAVESAFHADGLDENYACRVASKMVRIALALCCFCNVKRGTVAFATPTIRQAVFQSVTAQIELVNHFFEHDIFANRGIHFAFELYANEPNGYRRYDAEIVEPLCWMHPLVSDLADPFMRAVSLRDMTIGGCRVHGSNLRLALRDLGLKAEAFIERCETYTGVLEMINALHDEGGSRARAIREFVSWMRRDQLNGALLRNVDIQHYAQEEAADAAGVGAVGGQPQYPSAAGAGPGGNHHRKFDVVADGEIIGADLGMRAASLLVVRRYIEQTTDVDLEMLSQIFTKEVNRYHETVIAENSPHDANRYKGPIELPDGSHILVCGEWIDEPSPRANWPRFIQCSHDVGIEIVEHH